MLVEGAIHVKLTSILSNLNNFYSLEVAIHNFKWVKISNLTLVLINCLFHSFNLLCLRYFCINHGDQRFFFNLKSSEMSYLALSASFEYLCYESKAIRYIFTLTLRALAVRVNPFKPEFIIVIFIHHKPRVAVAILDLQWMKMIWSGWEIKENSDVLVNQFHWNSHSKTLGCMQIKSVFRDVKWCFNASWGLKGLKRKTYEREREHEYGRDRREIRVTSCPHTNAKTNTRSDCDGDAKTGGRATKIHLLYIIFLWDPGRTFGYVPPK